MRSDKSDMQKGKHNLYDNHINYAFLSAYQIAYHIIETVLNVKLVLTKKKNRGERGSQFVNILRLVSFSFQYTL